MTALPSATSASASTGATSRGTRTVAPAEAADARAVAGMLEHWERSLVAIGFLDPAAPKKLMPRLQQLFNRARPTVEEIHILRGIAKMMAQPQRGAVHVRDAASVAKTSSSESVSLPFQLLNPDKSD